jgi:hypothetical protein
MNSSLSHSVLNKNFVFTLLCDQLRPLSENYVARLCRICNKLSLLFKPSACMSAWRSNTNQTRMRPGASRVHGWECLGSYSFSGARFSFSYQWSVNFPNNSIWQQSSSFNTAVLKISSSTTNNSQHGTLPTKQRQLLHSKPRKQRILDRIGLQTTSLRLRREHY